MIPTPDEIRFIKRWAVKAAEVFDFMGWTWGEMVDHITADMIEQKVIKMVKEINNNVVGQSTGHIDVSRASYGSIELEAGIRFKLLLDLGITPFITPFNNSKPTEDTT